VFATVRHISTEEEANKLNGDKLYIPDDITAGLALAYRQK